MLGAFVDLRLMGRARVGLCLPRFNSVRATSLNRRHYMQGAVAAA